MSIISDHGNTCDVYVKPSLEHEILSDFSHLVESRVKRVNTYEKQRAISAFIYVHTSIIVVSCPCE